MFEHQQQYIEVGVLVWVFFSMDLNLFCWKFSYIRLLRTNMTSESKSHSVCLIKHYHNLLSAFDRHHSEDSVVCLQCQQLFRRCYSLDLSHRLLITEFGYQFGVKTWKGFLFLEVADEILTVRRKRWRMILCRRRAEECFYFKDEGTWKQKNCLLGRLGHIRLTLGVNYL